MNYDALREYFRDTGDPDVVGAYVVAGRCAACAKPIGDPQFVLALPSPYHCLLHLECKDFFQFNRAWPHPRPAHAYINRRRRARSANLTESGEMRYLE